MTVLAMGWVSGSRERRTLARVLAASASLVLVVSTRNLLWMYVGFEAFTLTAWPVTASAVAVSFLSLAGLLVVALSSSGLDLAVLESGDVVAFGVLLFIAGMILKWLHAGVDEGLRFLAAGIAVVAIFVRLSAWAPGTAEVLAPLTSFVAAIGILVGGGMSAVSARRPWLVTGLTIAHVGFAVVALPGGAPVLPHVLMHLAASALAITLLYADPSRLGLWLVALSLASVPPFPGFVTKLPVASSVTTETLVVMLAGGFLVGIGSVRALGRAESSAEGKGWVTVLAIALTVAFGLLPEGAFRLAALAVTELF